MYLISVIPIYKNKFQEPVFFFSRKKFSVGSLVITPLSKKGRPAIIIETDNLNKNKSFVRNKKDQINKIVDFYEEKLISEKLIDLIKLATEKTSFPIEEIFQKITPSKIIKEINNLQKNKNLEKSKNFFANIDKEFIKEKLLKKKKKEEEQGDKNNGLKNIGSLLSTERVQKKTLYSEKHYLVDEIRNYFGETAKKGKGSFSFYLGFFKRIPENKIYEFWSEVKQSNKNIKDQQKLFWWKVGQYLKK